MGYNVAKLDPSSKALQNVVKFTLEGLTDIGSWDNKLFYLKTSKIGLVVVGSSVELDSEQYTEIEGAKVSQNTCLLTTVDKVFVSGRKEENKTNYLMLYDHELKRLSQSLFLMENQSRPH